VFCQLEILRHCLPPSVRGILEELPESLDETYERILREIRKPNQEHAHRLLQSLVAAVRPLRVKELAEVLAVDFTEGMPRLKSGHHCQGGGFTYRSIFAFFRQGIFDGETAGRVHQRCLPLSHST
jgi:hypothetical protein